MTTSKELLTLVAQIKATTGRADKHDLLRQLVADETGRRIVRAAYDPFVTYGVKISSPLAVDGGKQFFDGDTWGLLDRLAQRELTGNAAKDAIVEIGGRLDEHGQELLWRILQKDLKCGIAENSIQLVDPTLIPVFSVMRAHKFEEKRIKTWPQVIEPKLDGFRVTFLCRNGNGGFFTRSGKRMPSLDHMVEEVIQAALTVVTSETASDDLYMAMFDRCKPFPTGKKRQHLNFVLDGEAMTGSFNETSGALRRESEDAEATYHIFDLMSYSEFDEAGTYACSYERRRRMVDDFVRLADKPNLTKTPRYYVRSIAEIHEFYERFRAAGLEGAMVKNPAGGYDKKKSYNWLKIKAEESEDLPIVGVFNGDVAGKYEKTIGGLIVRRANGVDVRVPGIADSVREEIWALWLKDAATLGVNPNVGYKPGYALDPAMSAHGFQLVNRLVEVEFHEETPDGSLRHPRFKRFRDDKAGEVESKEAA